MITSGNSYIWADCFNPIMRFIPLFLIPLFFGCTSNSDSVVHGGDFSVYFQNKTDRDIAEQIVRFWKREDLMTGKDQDVKLVRTKEGYDIYLIAIGDKTMDVLSFEEIEALTELKQRLQEEVFKDKKVGIVLTDDSFKPLFRPVE
jgi:hypothetical protein